jgi:DNA-binding LacI/PurR family transcriptional regulator
MLPAASRVAVLARVDDPFTNIFLAQIEAGARIAGVSIRPVMIYPTQKFDAAFEDMKTNQTDAIIIQGAAYCTKMLPIWLSKIDFLRSPRTDSCLRWEA